MNKNAFRLYLSGEMVNTERLKRSAVRLRGSSPLLDKKGDIIQSGRMLMLHIKYPSSNLGISKPGIYMYLSTIAWEAQWLSRILKLFWT